MPQKEDHLLLDLQQAVCTDQRRMEPRSCVTSTKMHGTIAQCSAAANQSPPARDCLPIVRATMNAAIYPFS